MAKKRPFLPQKKDFWAIIGLLAHLVPSCFLVVSCCMQAAVKMGCLPKYLIISTVHTFLSVYMKFADL